MALNPKQKAFVAEYVKDFNASRAARDAGYSEKTAGEQGFDLLKKPEIQASVRETLDALQEKCEVSATKTLREIAIIAFGKVTDLGAWDESGLIFHNAQDLTPEAAALIQSVKTKTFASENGTTTTIEVKLHDKLRALEMLGRYLSLFKDTLDVTHRVVETVPMSPEQAEEWANIRKKDSLGALSD